MLIELRQDIEPHMEQQSKNIGLGQLHTTFLFLLKITGHSNAPTILSLTSDILSEKFASNLGLQCPSTNGDSVRRRLKSYVFIIK